MIVIGLLVAVLLFGDDTFGARRALINGSLQPGEAAELVMVVYMAAWLSSRRTKIRSIAYGLLPFSMILGIVGGLVMLQPDLSTAAVIFVVCGTMFFLAGADFKQLVNRRSHGGCRGLAGDCNSACCPVMLKTGLPLILLA